MSLIGRTFTDCNVTAKVDGGLYQAVFGDGIIRGCTLTTNATALTIQAGSLMVGGRIISNDAALSYTLTPTVETGYGRVIVNVKLDETTPYYLSADYSASGTFSALTQEAINDNGNLYQAVLAVVRISSSQVTGIDSQMQTIGLGSNMRASLASDLFPVGTILGTVNNVNPSTYLGGTWVAYSAGKTLFGVDANDSDFAAAEQTGGAKTVTLTATQIPTHSHTISITTGNQSANHTHSGTTGSSGTHLHAGCVPNHIQAQAGTGAAYGYVMDGSWVNTPNAGDHTHAFTTGNNLASHTHSVNGNSGNVGGNAAHTNLPPYTACYFWKRTA